MNIKRQRALPLNDNCIGRDLNLSEKDDYTINILPYEKQGYGVYPIGEHRNGAYIVFGWKILINGANRY